MRKILDITKHYDASVADVAEKETHASLGEKPEKQQSLMERLHEQKLAIEKQLKAVQRELHDEYDR